jgi:Phage integrase family
MLLAASGMRAVEALSIRTKDLDRDSNPANVFVRGGYTKTKIDRRVYLTEETTRQLKSWLDYKYRTRRVCHKEEQHGKVITEYRMPNKKDSDLVFAVYQDKKTPNPDFIYDGSSNSFAKILDLMGKGSEWFIGHSGSAYWTKKDLEKAEIFRKVEPYLTFLNIVQLERQGADIQCKVGELKELNESLRQRDKMKDDAIAQSSDQLMALTARMREIERRQQPYQ